ncbi:MAG: hypothetical protein F4095_07100, partial [Acidimicrobiia bacterium]|nr:hypothetical protein [Acidimicrobiia bacterium]
MWRQVTLRTRPRAKLLLASAAVAIAFAVSGGAVAVIDEQSAVDHQSNEGSVAERCYAHHGLAQRPIPVARTADLQTDLAVVQWDYNESIGCYLTLDGNALAVLRCQWLSNHAPLLSTRCPPSQIYRHLPAHDEQAVAEAEAVAKRCFAAYGVGLEPIPVVKTANGQVVLAAVSWAHDEANRCHLTIDDVALGQLRNFHATDPTRNSFHGSLLAPKVLATAVSVGTRNPCALRIYGKVVCWRLDGHYTTRQPEGAFVAVSAGGAHGCGVRSDLTLVCWGDNGKGQADPPEGAFVAVSAGG